MVETAVIDSNVFTRGIVSQMMHDLLVLNLVTDGRLPSVYTQATLNEIKNVFHREEVNRRKVTDEHRKFSAQVINASILIKPFRAQIIKVYRHFEREISQRHGSQIIAAAYQAFDSENICLIITNDRAIVDLKPDLGEFGVEVLTPLDLLVTRFGYKLNDE